MSLQNRTQLFDDWAGRYDPSSSERFPFIGYEAVLDAIVELAALGPGCSVLDLGIGTGNLAARCVDRGCEVWGVDFSAGMLDRVRERLPDVTLVRADLTSDELPPELHRRFDRIVSGYTFHEFDDAAKVTLLKRLTEHHLSEEGTIVIGDIAFPTAAARMAAHDRWAKLWDDDEYYWAADEMIAACEAAGLSMRFVRVSECGGVAVIAAL